MLEQRESAEPEVTEEEEHVLETNPQPARRSEEQPREDGREPRSDGQAGGGLTGESRESGDYTEGKLNAGCDINGDISGVSYVSLV